MNPEPLKGQLGTDDYGSNFFVPYSVESAVAGLIQFHEDRIEELIKEMQNEDKYELLITSVISKIIDIEYESIMAIEHWLEDVI